MKKSNLLPLITATILASVGTAASAQNLNFLRESPIGWLDESDQAILEATIDALLEAPDGTTTDWLNPETGAHGRIQVMDTHQDFGTTCRRMKMRNEAKGRKGGGTYRLCQAEDDTWKFAPVKDQPMKETSATTAD